MPRENEYWPVCDVTSSRGPRSSDPCYWPETPEAAAKWIAPIFFLQTFIRKVGVSNITDRSMRFQFCSGGTRQKSIWEKPMRLAAWLADFRAALFAFMSSVDDSFAVQGLTTLEIAAGHRDCIILSPPASGAKMICERFVTENICDPLPD